MFDDLRRRSPLPLLSIVEATRDAARSLGLRTVGLLGTRFTMQGRFYTDVFEAAGIALVTPAPDEQAFIHDRYMNELVNGLFTQPTRERFLSITRRLAQEDGIKGLILGGTELPLLMRGAEVPGVTLLDTTRLHVEQVVERRDHRLGRSSRQAVRGISQEGEDSGTRKRVRPAEARECAPRIGEAAARDGNDAGG